MRIGEGDKMSRERAQGKKVRAKAGLSVMATCYMLESKRTDTRGGGNQRTEENSTGLIT